MTMIMLIADIALAVTVVLGLGSVAALVLRKGSPALRHAAWRATLAGVWLAPVAVIAAGMLPVQRPEIAVPVPRYEPAHAPVAEAPPAPIGEPMAPALEVAPAAEPAPRAPLPLAAILLSLWAAGAVVALVAFGRDATALRALLAEGAPSDRPATVEAIAQRLGLARLPRVRRSAEVSVPAVAGWLRPTLVLPEDRPAEEAALIHELAHVQRGDLPTLAAARLTAAVWWWHPLAWLMLRGLAATAEEACDDVVLALTGARREYAQMLTDWAERASVAGAVNCGSHGKGLVARVRRVLDEGVRPVVHLSARARAIVASMMVCAVIVSASMHVRAADEAPAMAAGTANTEGEEVILTGRVLSPDGTPVVDAAVYTYYQPITPSGRAPWPWTEARTDQAGLFRIAFTTGKVSGRYSLVAFKDGLAAGWQLVEPGTAAEIRMRPDPAACEGVVRDAAGQPIEGAEVRLAFLNLVDADTREHVTFGSLPVATTRSDAAGRFSIPGLPRGAEVWTATTAEGHAYKWGPDAKPAVAGTAFGITLAPEARISGRVVHNGQPVAGIAVGAYSQMDVLAPDAVTDEAGRFELGQLPAGTYAVTAVSSDEYIARPVREITLATGEHRADVQIDVLAPAVIEGRLTDADTDDPVEGARVEASDQSWTITPEAGRLATSDADGRYSLRVLPGQVLLRCLGAGERYPWGMVTPERLSLDVAEGQVLSDVDFSLTKAAGLAGIVLDPEGNAVADAEVSALAPYSSAQQAVLTDTDGRFELASPGSGGAEASLFVTHAGRELAAFLPVEDGAKQITVHLQEAAWIQTRVTDLDGTPIAGMTLQLRTLLDRSPIAALPLQAASGGDGRITIAPVPPNVPLALMPEGDAAYYAANLRDWSPGKFDLAPGETLELEPLLLNPDGRTVTGAVFDERVRPVADAQLSGAVPHVPGWLSGPQLATTTDARGRFELGGLKASGSLCLLAVAQDGQTAGAVAWDPDTEPQPMLTLMPLGSVGGTVRAADGTPIANGVVYLGAARRGFVDRVVKKLEL